MNLIFFTKNTWVRTLFFLLVGLTPSCHVSDVSAEYFTVSSIAVSSNDSNLETSKKNAINDGKLTAIDAVLNQVLGSQNPPKLSTSQIDDCIESYAIESEKFIKNSYQAVVSYSVDVSKVRAVVNTGGVESARSVENSTYNKYLVTIEIQDIKRDYRNLERFIQSQNLQFRPYSVASNFIKIYANDDLIMMLQKAKIRFRQEVING